MLAKPLFKLDWNLDWTDPFTCNNSWEDMCCRLDRMCFFSLEKYPFISYEQYYKTKIDHQATIDLVHSSLGPIPQHSTTP